MKIYLAGTGSDPEFAMSWRAKAEGLLYPAETFNPFRGRTILPGNIWDHEAYTDNEIVLRDLEDIDTSDVVLAEMVRMDSASYIGTPMEIFYARQKQKPVVLWIPRKNQQHFWLRYCSVKMFEDLSDACDYIRSTWKR